MNPITRVLERLGGNSSDASHAVQGPGHIMEGHVLLVPENGEGFLALQPNTVVETSKLKLGRQLGQGSFATVHKAVYDSKVVAVKVLRPEFLTHQTVTRMLLKEAGLLASLSHPYILRCQGACLVQLAGQPAALPAMITEYHEGGSLGDLLLKQMRQPREHLFTDTEGLTWLLQVAEALVYLHRHEPTITHRDVKPANVLLGAPGDIWSGASRAGGSGGVPPQAGGRNHPGPSPRTRWEARLCDFGLHQVIRPVDHRPMVRVSTHVAHASSSGIFHTPRVSEEGSLLLPPSLLDAFQRVRSRTEMGLAANALSDYGCGGAGVGSDGPTGMSARTLRPCTTMGVISEHLQQQPPLPPMHQHQQHQQQHQQQQQLYRSSGAGAPVGGPQQPQTNRVARTSFAGMPSATAAAVAALSAAAAAYGNQAQRLQQSLPSAFAASHATTSSSTYMSFPQRAHMTSAESGRRDSHNGGGGGGIGVDIPSAADISPFVVAPEDLAAQQQSPWRRQEPLPRRLPQRPSELISPPLLASLQLTGTGTGTATGAASGGGGAASSGSRPIQGWIQRHKQRRMATRRSSCPRLGMGANTGAGAAAAVPAAGRAPGGALSPLLLISTPPAVRGASYGRTGPIPLASGEPQLSQQSTSIRPTTIAAVTAASAAAAAAEALSSLELYAAAPRLLTPAAMAGVEPVGEALDTLSLSAHFSPPAPPLDEVSHTGGARISAAAASAFQALTGPRQMVRLPSQMMALRGSAFGMDPSGSTSGGGGGGGGAGCASSAAVEVSGMSSESSCVAEVPFLERVFPLSGQCGSSIYMSPEVAQEQPYNEKADVFSFAITAFEVATRTLICQTACGRNGLAFTRMMVDGRRPVLPPHVDPRVASLIRACWHADPLERPTMAQVVTALQQILYGDSVGVAASAPFSSPSVLRSAHRSGCTLASHASDPAAAAGASSPPPPLLQAGIPVPATQSAAAVQRKPLDPLSFGDGSALPHIKPYDHNQLLFQLSSQRSFQTSQSACCDTTAGDTSVSTGRTTPHCGGMVHWLSTTTGGTATSAAHLASASGAWAPFLPAGVGGDGVGGGDSRRGGVGSLPSPSPNGSRLNRVPSRMMSYVQTGARINDAQPLAAPALPPPIAPSAPCAGEPTPRPPLHPPPAAAAQQAAEACSASSAAPTVENDAMLYDTVASVTMAGVAAAAAAATRESVASGYQEEPSFGTTLTRVSLAVRRRDMYDTTVTSRGTPILTSTPTAGSGPLAVPPGPNNAGARPRGSPLCHASIGSSGGAAAGAFSATEPGGGVTARAAALALANGVPGSGCRGAVGPREDEEEGGAGPVCCVVS